MGVGEVCILAAGSGGCSPDKICFLCLIRWCLRPFLDYLISMFVNTSQKLCMYATPRGSTGSQKRERVNASALSGPQKILVSLTVLSTALWFAVGTAWRYE